MGTPSREPRDRRVTLRFSEKEYAQLRMQMENVDFLSVSKYIRTKVLDGTIQISRKLVLTDRNLRNQINRLTAVIVRIGADYNQVTMKMNSLLKQKNPDGSEVINPRSASFFLSRIYKDTLSIKEAMSMVVEKIDKLDYDNIPHVGGEHKTI